MEGRTAKFWIGGLILLNLLWLVKTSANFVGYVDSGELAVACFSLGIAHPTGYPFYTLIGKALTMFHPGSVIEGVTFVSVIFGLGSGILFVLLLSKLLRRLNVFANSKPGSLLAASTSMVVLLYCPIMWSLSVTNEVYTLHLFFVTSIFFLVLTATGHAYGQLARTVVLGSYLIGLALSHHLSTVLLIPALIFWVLANRSIRKRAVRLLLVSIPAFILALTVYLYMPIRALQSPIANWGNPSTIENLVRHASGWQYQVWMFNKSLSGIFGSMADLLVMTVTQFPIFMLIPAVLGLVVLTVKDRIASVFIAIVFVTNLVYLAGYTIPEIDTYLLPMIMIYALWAVTGTAAICVLILKAGGRRRIVRFAPYLTAGVLLAVGLYMIAVNRNFADRSDYRYVETQSTLLLNSMEPRAVMLTANWDFYSPLLYKKFAEGVRTDVTAIDIELLRRSWYYDFIAESDPNLFANIKNEVQVFMPLVRSFERDERIDQGRIEDAYQSIITAIASVPDRPVYADLSAQFRDSKMFSKIPEGPVYRLVRQDEAYSPKPFSRMSLGAAKPDLLESDYSLKKQIEIIDVMNREWKAFWEWYQVQNGVIPDS